MVVIWHVVHVQGNINISKWINIAFIKKHGLNINMHGWEETLLLRWRERETDASNL